MPPSCHTRTAGRRMSPQLRRSARRVTKSSCACAKVKLPCSSLSCLVSDNLRRRGRCIGPAPSFWKVVAPISCVPADCVFGHSAPDAASKGARTVIECRRRSRNRRALIDCSGRSDASKRLRPRRPKPNGLNVNAVQAISADSVVRRRRVRQRKKPRIREAFRKYSETCARQRRIGSATRTRTWDPVINSRSMLGSDRIVLQKISRDLCLINEECAIH